MDKPNENNGEKKEMQEQVKTIETTLCISRRYLQPVKKEDYIKGYILNGKVIETGNGENPNDHWTRVDNRNGIKEEYWLNKNHASTGHDSMYGAESLFVINGELYRDNWNAFNLTIEEGSYNVGGYGKYHGWKKKEIEGDYDSTVCKQEEILGGDKIAECSKTGCINPQTSDSFFEKDGNLYLVSFKRTHHGEETICKKLTPFKGVILVPKVETKE